MENQVRTRWGKPGLSIEALIVRFAMREVIEHTPMGRLIAGDARSAARVAMLRALMSIQARPEMIDDQIHPRRDGSRTRGSPSH
jgi:hypothetical protein